MKKEWTSEDIESIRRLYVDEQMSAAEVGIIVGRSEYTIRSWMRRHGIPSRSHSESTKLSFKDGKRKRQVANVPLKSHLTCRNCGADWEYQGESTKTTCPFCGSPKEARDRKGEYKRYSGKTLPKLKAFEQDKEKMKAHRVRQRLLQRRRLLFKVSGSIHPSCVRCGCDDIRFLEINHKFGGGSQELKNGKTSHQRYRDILQGRRQTDDLELLCKPCNAVHALELKYGVVSLQVVFDADAEGG